MRNPRDHALSLLSKAANDPVAGRATLATGQAFDAVCFHAQQAVEKSLKAALALHDVEYPWRHDLGELLALIKPLVPSIASHEASIIRMTPYAVEARYDAEFAPTFEEAGEALRLAAEIHRLIREIVEQT